jgi:putative aldouronate transport system substrate-binding protein
MYNKGILDPDSFTQSHDDFLTKIASGRVLSVQTSTWVYAQANGTLVEEGKDDRLFAHLPITKSPDIPSNSCANIGWSGGWGVSITKKCKDIDRAFDFLNWSCSDEAQILKNWGIEGVHWHYDGDGKRVQFDEVRKAIKEDTNYFRIAGVNRYTYPWPQRGNGVKDPSGNNYTTETIQRIIEGYTKAETEALDAYGASIWADLHPPTSSFEQSPFGAAWQVAIPADTVAFIAFNQLMDYIAMALPRTVVCSPDDFDAEYDKYITGMYQYEVEEMNKTFTDLVKAKVEFWK